MRVYSAFDIKNVQRKTLTKYRRTCTIIHFHDEQSYNVAQHAGWGNQAFVATEKRGGSHPSGTRPGQNPQQELRYENLIPPQDKTEKYMKHIPYNPFKFSPMD